MFRAIVSREIEITYLVGKSNLSQNEEARDIHSVVETLKVQGDCMIGDVIAGFC